MAHTILLMQGTHDVQSKTYANYKTFDDCIDGVCKIYEEHLKKVNPQVRVIHYEIGHLFQFIEQLPALSCLVYQEETKSYAPYFKSYIKEKVYCLLAKASGINHIQNENVPPPGSQKLFINDVDPLMKRMKPNPIEAPWIPISERIASQNATWQENKAEVNSTT